MDAKRTATFLLSTLLLGGCSTNSGIVDNFVPPQAQPRVERRVANCGEPLPPSGETQISSGVRAAQAIAPCVAETVAAIAGAQTARTPRQVLSPGRLTLPRHRR